MSAVDHTAPPHSSASIYVPAYVFIKSCSYVMELRCVHVYRDRKMQCQSIFFMYSGYLKGEGWVRGEWETARNAQNLQSLALWAAADLTTIRIYECTDALVVWSEDDDAIKNSRVDEPTHMRYILNMNNESLISNVPNYSAHYSRYFPWKTRRSYS